MKAQSINTVKTVRTVAFMMIATILSKVLGMLRSVIQASHYGTGMEANAFSEASHIPLTFFDLLLSAAILGCFIPVYNSFKNNKEADDFACVFFNTVLLFTGALTILGIIFAQPIVGAIAYKLPTETQDLTVKLLRIMFPMIIFTGTAYTIVGLMQSKGKYLLPALISSVSNLGVIIYLLFWDMGIYGLATAYILAWFIQLLTLVIPLLRNGFKYKLLFDFKNPALREAIRRAPPIMIGSWLTPVGIMSALYFAPFVGNITVFDYSNNVYVIIAGTLTYSICNYAFPMLSKLSAQGDLDTFNNTVRTGITASIFIVIPFMFGVFTVGSEGVAILYMRKAFSPADAALTAHTLNYMALGMPAFAMVEILSRVFYAKNLSKIPMIASLCGIAVNIIFSALFVSFRENGIGAIGLANALGQIAAALTLLIAVGTKLRGVFTAAFTVNIFKIATISVPSYLTMLILYRICNNSPFTSGMLHNIITAAIVFIPGAAIYVILAGLSKVKFKI